MFKKVNLILVRGLPGSGKTTLAKLFGVSMVAADDFFMEDKEYVFDPSKLSSAHQWCLTEAETRLESRESVVVHNTFTQRWEMEPYIKIAKKSGVHLSVVSTYDGGCTDKELAERNSHGVPLRSVEDMRKRWEFDWKSGNPLAPWER
jgi:predicted kinase